MARTPRAAQIPGAAPAADTTTDTTDLAASEAQGLKEFVFAGEAGASGALTAADYAQMHSSQVDATKLKRSVLCKDGWVVPDLPPQAPVRA